MDKERKRTYNGTGVKENGKGKDGRARSRWRNIFEGRECFAAYHGSWLLMSLPCGPSLAAASAGTNTTAVQVPGQGKDRERKGEGKEKRKRKGKRTSEKRKGTCFVTSAFDGVAPPTRFSFSAENFGAAGK